MSYVKQLLQNNRRIREPSIAVSAVSKVIFRLHRLLAFDRMEAVLFKWTSYAVSMISKLALYSWDTSISNLLSTDFPDERNKRKTKRSKFSTFLFFSSTC